MRWLACQLGIILLFLSPVVGQAALTDPTEKLADTQNSRYQGLTGKQRVRWIVRGTFGPRSLAQGLITSGLATASNRPDEYGPHWDGFGKRYGMRLTGIATERVMEAGLGALWGEDPRYFRSSESRFKPRLKHVIALTFESRYADGEIRPAYARLISIPASSYLSNTWRADSVATNSDAIKRAAFGFVARMGSNAFAEFSPDLKRILRKRKDRK